MLRSKLFHWSNQDSRKSCILANFPKFSPKLISFFRNTSYIIPFHLDGIKRLFNSSGLHRIQSRERELFDYSLEDSSDSCFKKSFHLPQNPSYAKKVDVPKQVLLSEPLVELKDFYEKINYKIDNQLYQTKFTKLDNGIIVATEETYSQMSAVGLFIKSGSKFENDSDFGLSMVLESISFRDSKNQTREEISACLEHLGAQVETTCTPDSITYSAEVLRDSTESVLKIISDTVFEPLISPENFEEAISKLKENISFQNQNPQVRIIDFLHRVAYPNETLGRGIIPDLVSIDKIKIEDLQRFSRNNFVGNRIILCGVSVDHEEFVEMAKKYFSNVPSSSEPDYKTKAAPIGTPSLSKPQYTGGMIKDPAPDDVENSLVSVAFDCGGLDQEDFFVVYTLKALMGGGSSFSAGGPGKGIYTRLYKDVVNSYGWVENCSSFIFSYSDAGLFGITVEVSAKATTRILDIICSEFLRMGASITEEELFRAKNQFKTSIMYNLESRAVVYDDIAKHLLAFGHRIPPPELNRMIDEISVDRILETARRILRSRPSVVVYAPQAYLDELVDYERILEYFDDNLIKLK